MSMCCCSWLHEAVSQGLNVAVLPQKADCGYQPLLKCTHFSYTHNVATLEADVSHVPGVLTGFMRVKKSLCSILTFYVSYCLIWMHLKYVCTSCVFCFTVGYAACCCELCVMYLVVQKCWSISLWLKTTPYILVTCGSTSSIEIMPCAWICLIVSSLVPYMASS